MQLTDRELWLLNFYRNSELQGALLMGRLARTPAAIPLLALVTFVQVLYLESVRLRPRDLASIRFFKETLEDKLGMTTEHGAGVFSLIDRKSVV